MEALAAFLREAGLEPVFSRCLYRRDGGPFSGTPQERAEELNGFFGDPEVGMILDISGGDAANGILPYLDYGAAGRSRALFWGYSDLTAVINALYAKTGRPSVLYQAAHLTEGDWQRRAFRSLISGKGGDLFRFSYEFIQGSSMEGIVAGGNIRCLLKLAGTPYWPDMRGKLLLLEARSGKVARISSFLAQLRQMGVFEQVSGILLGTFLELEERREGPSIEKLVLEYAGRDIPVARTGQIGHRTDSHGIWIGRRLEL